MNKKIQDKQIPSIENKNNNNENESESRELFKLFKNVELLKDVSKEDIFYQRVETDQVQAFAIQIPYNEDAYNKIHQNGWKEKIRITVIIYKQEEEHNKMLVSIRQTGIFKKEGKDNNWLTLSNNWFTLSTEYKYKNHRATEVFINKYTDLGYFLYDNKNKKFYFIENNKEKEVTPETIINSLNKYFYKVNLDSYSLITKLNLFKFNCQKRLYKFLIKVFLRFEKNEIKNLLYKYFINEKLNYEFEQKTENRCTSNPANARISSPFLPKPPTNLSIFGLKIPLLDSLFISIIVLSLSLLELKNLNILEKTINEFNIINLANIIVILILVFIFWSWVKKIFVGIKTKIYNFLYTIMPITSWGTYIIYDPQDKFESKNDENLFNKYLRGKIKSSITEKYIKIIEGAIKFELLESQPKKTHQKSAGN